MMALPMPFVLSATEGEKVIAGPFTIVSRVQGPQSAGVFELYELALGVATIDYHVHRTMDETLAVVAGQIDFLVAGEEYVRPAGSVAFVPRGVHHGFTNRGPEQARVLILFTPAGNQHEYFRQLERLLSAPSVDAKALAAAQKQYDQELVPLDR